MAYLPWRRVSGSFLLLYLLAAVFFSCQIAGLNLPMGDINVVVITDDHSWVGGHGAHESLDADYGDVLSFYERLASTTKDVFLTHNGDWIDGTGLTTYPPTYLEPILLKMPWDAVNVGNHDLYKNETVEYITRKGGLVDNLGERYLTSNVVHSATGKPIGQHFRYLKGKNVSVLTLGFMYNIEPGIGSPLARVTRVEDVVKEKWFLKELRQGNYDAILVLAHMGVKNKSLRTILSTIRNETDPIMPVQFISGHMHKKRYKVLDEYSTAIEPGCYLKTVGFVSFPTKQTVLKRSSESVLELFRYELIDARVKDLSSRLGVSKLRTENGQALTDFIRKTQQDMGLSRIVGCSPRTFYMNRTLQSVDSLFGLWAREVVTSQFLSENPKRVVLQGTRSSFRYDLFEGNVTVDDLMIVSPFNDSMYLVAKGVPSRTIFELNIAMNQERVLNRTPPVLPHFIVIGNITADEPRDLYTLEYEVPFIKQALENITGRVLQPKPVEAFATSLWLSFVEEFWQECASVTGVDIDFGMLNTKQIAALAPASPGRVTLLVVTMSAVIACFLLGRFMLRRLPTGRRRLAAHIHPS